MNTVFDNGYVQLVCGHVLDVLGEMPVESVHCVVTSPPYWGLRDYKIEPLVWGCDVECQHEWGIAEQSYNKPFTYPDGAGEVKSLSMGYVQHGSICLRCSAWRGSLGLEPLHDCLAWASGKPPCPTCYVCHMRTIAKALWRVLRKDGTMWLNLGDSYCGGGNNSGSDLSDLSAKQYSNRGARDLSYASIIPQGLKPKDLVGIPWRVAMALQADGWYLRSDIIWHKLNPMPESVRDRPTKSHEYVFLFSKSQQYYYDQQAIREGEAGVVGQADTYFLPNGRNRRSVWPIASKPFEGAHFAVFPEALVEPCILAGTSEKGCCGKCGIQRTRVIRTNYRKNRPSAGDDPRSHGNDKLAAARGPGGWKGNNLLRESQTLGWQPTCACHADAIPCTVLDPFVGSGTTCVLAQKLGRKSIGIDLQPMYLELAKKRLAEVPIPMPLET